MKHSAFFYVLFALSLAFLVACADDDSDTFLVRGDDTSYSNEEDDFSSSSARSSSSEVRSSSSSALSSSSSEQRGSSSSVRSSSSSVRYSYLEVFYRNGPSVNCNFGTLRDDRDGQVYRTVVIGKQTWMAENLNYAYLRPDSLGKLDSASACFYNLPEYCDVFGRLYSLDAGTKVCPEGWHLPSLEDWDVMLDAVGGAGVANPKLISSYGWKEQMSVSDPYCFTVLPGGFYDSTGYRNLEIGASYWTTTWDDTFEESPVRNIYFDNHRDYVYEGGATAVHMMYIRCLRD